MSLAVDRIEEDARTQTGLDDTGGDYYREGLQRLVESMNVEGGLTELGEAMQQMRLSMLLAARLRIEETYRLHPEIDDEADRRTGVRHRPAPYRHHRTQPAGGG